MAQEDLNQNDLEDMITRGGYRFVILWAAGSLLLYAIISPSDAMSQCLLHVIPDEDAPGSRDPESRKGLLLIPILDPGSRPALRPTSLTSAGMTTYDTPPSRGE